MTMLSYYEWQENLTRFYDVMPTWYWSSAERYRRYQVYKEIRKNENIHPYKPACDPEEQQDGTKRATHHSQDLEVK